MPPTATFGRRTVPGPARRPAAPTGGELSPEAEAFRRDLAAAAAAPSEFERWRRRTRPGRWGAWALSFALLTPGLVCFLVEAPVAVSTALEFVGIALGAWLRAARRARLQAVRAWEPDAPA